MKTQLVLLTFIAVSKCEQKSHLLDALNDSVDEMCRSQLKNYVSTLTTKEVWALEMFYASANFEKELFYGNSWDFGDIDRCLRINFNSGEGRNTEKIRGKYCLIQYYATNRTIKAIPPASSFYNPGWKSLDKRFGGAICIPRSCPSSIIPAIMEQIFNGTDLRMSTDYDDPESYCKTKDPVDVKAIDYVAVIIIVSLLSLQIASTAYDLQQRKKNLATNQLFISFSLYTNLKDVFNTHRHESDKAISYLSGMKALSSFGIIFLHTHFFRIQFPLHNSNIMENFNQRYLSVILFKLAILVDTFLLITGFLIARTIFRELNDGSYSVLKTYFRRYMRITPILILTLPILLLLAHFMPAAPYSFSKYLIEPCTNYWWSYFLHIQNYVNVHELCNPASWYLSVDYQMFLLTPLLVCLIWKWNWISFIVFPILLAGIHYLTYMRTVILVPTFEGFFLTLNIYGESADFYHQTQFRASPWIVGIMLGIFVSQHAKLKLSKFSLSTMWIITFLMSAVLLAPGLQKLLEIPEFHELILHVALQFNKLWTFAVAWIILACHYGFSSKVNWFLSLPIWMPVEKIGLSIYLIHSFIITNSVLWQKQPFDFDGSIMISKYIFDCIIGLLAGLVCHLSIEKPFTLIGRHLSKNW